MIERFTDSNRSFMRLPLWVRLWLVFILIPVNIAAFFIKDTPTGYWAAWAAAFIGAVNGSVILMQRGWGKALAVPHLIAWMPLLIFAARRLKEPGVPRRERVYAVVLIAVNGASVVFDAVDTWRWARRERGVP